MEVCSQFIPKLLIGDVVMPGMNGVELSISIKSKFPRCKILLLSGQAATEQMLLRAHEQGYDFEVLAKPVHPLDLLAKVAELIGAGKSAAKRQTKRVA